MSVDMCENLPQARAHASMSGHPYIYLDLEGGLTELEYGAPPALVPCAMSETYLCL